MQPAPPASSDQAHTLAPTPATIKWIVGLVVLQTLISILFVVLVIWLVNYQPDAGFWKGFRDSMQERVGVLNAYNAGRIAAMPLLSVILAVPVLVVFRKRRAAGIAYWLMAVLIVMLLINKSFPALLLVAYLLMFSHSARTYLSGKTPAKHRT